MRVRITKRSVHLSTSGVLVMMNVLDFRRVGYADGPTSWTDPIRTYTVGRLRFVTIRERRTRLDRIAYSARVRVTRLGRRIVDARQDVAEWVESYRDRLHDAAHLKR